MNRPIPWLAALSLLAAHTVFAHDPSDPQPSRSPADITPLNIPPELLAPQGPAPAENVQPALPPVTPAGPPDSPPRRQPGGSNSYAINPRPAQPINRHIVVMYGDSAPTLHCAPMHVCDIELQPGEVVQGKPYIGDPNRWKVWPAMSGRGSQQMTHLIIEPSEPGLDTNLMVPTDRHTYHLHLHSSLDNYVFSVSYFYPDERPRATAGANGTAGDIDEIPIVPAHHLSFSYRIKIVSGNPSLKPVRVMDDGLHTYIAMNDQIPAEGAPVLIGASADGREHMVPYRFKGNLFVTDGVYARVSLLSASHSSAQRIELTRDPCNKRGWLGICWDRKE